MKKNDRQRHQQAQALITDRQFNQLLDDLTDHAMTHNVKDSGEDLTPYLVIAEPKDEDGKQTLVMILLAVEYGQEDKYRVMFALGMTAAKNHVPVAAVFLVSEAWLSIRLEGQERLEPRLDPNREDVVIVNGLTLDGRNNDATIHLVEGENGRQAGRVNKVYHGDTGYKHTANRMLVHFLKGYAAGVVDGIAPQN